MGDNAVCFDDAAAAAAAAAARQWHESAGDGAELLVRVFVHLVQDSAAMV